jgi:hypothetical protein
VKLDEHLVVRGLSFFSNIPHLADQWPDLGNNPEFIKPVFERSTEPCSLVLGSIVFTTKNCRLCRQDSSEVGK